jgi:hypothetical protein
MYNSQYLIKEHHPSPSYVQVRQLVFQLSTSEVKRTRLAPHYITPGCRIYARSSRPLVTLGEVGWYPVPRSATGLIKLSSGLENAGVLEKFENNRRIRH